MVDLRVVNDLADDEEPALFENFARGVSEIDRALDPVTKAELRADAHQCVKLRCGLAFQTNAAVGPRNRMDKALMKSVSRRELTPVTHRITDVMSAAIAAARRDAVALDTEAVGTGALVLLLRINCETAVRCRFVRQTH